MALYSTIVYIMNMYMIIQGTFFSGTLTVDIFSTVPYLLQNQYIRNLPHL